MVFALVCIAALGGGLVLLLQPGRGLGTEVSLGTGGAVGGTKVRVSGAVSAPGVYVVQQENTLEEVIAAAGGLLPGADISDVRLGPPVGNSLGGRVGQPVVNGVAVDEGNLLDINVASEAELMELDGIGEVRARDIVEYRRENGPFGSVDGLTEVPGIGKGTVEAVRHLIRAGVGAP